MNRFFIFNRNQRIGVVVLLLIIIVLQVVYFTVDFSGGTIDVDNKQLMVVSKELDSLRQMALKPKKDTIYPFNPNFITDYKGFMLGMKPDEIDRLLAFRSENKFVNSAEEFQAVTQISDSLLAEIAPYFKFPKWVKNNKSTENKYFKTEKTKSESSPKNEKAAVKKDVNQATKEDFMEIYGIGEVLSQRILKFRTKLQGFTYISQVSEVYGLQKEVFDRLAEQFDVKIPPEIQKKDINKLDLYELAKTPYLTFDDAKKVVTLRSELGRIKKLDDLLTISGFDKKRVTMLQIYLYVASE